MAFLNLTLGLTTLLALLVGASLTALLLRQRISIDIRRSSKSSGSSPQETDTTTPLGDSHDSELPLLLTTAMDSLSMGVVICDAKGETAFENGVARYLFQARHEDALAARALNDLLALARLGTYTERVVEFFGPPKKSYRIVSFPLILQGSPSGFAAIFEDVSEKRHLDEVRRDFVANVSHELKTPIGAMALLAETMEEEEDFKVLKRLAARIHAESIRVGRIISDLLDLSRLESEETPKRGEIEVSRLISEAVHRVTNAADTSLVTVSIGNTSDGVIIVGDERQLVSAITNLLENAIKYSEENREVIIKSEQEENWLVISVQDHGIGIPSRDIERIFERFYRVDQNRSRSTGGTGLGLAIVRHVINNHMGKIEVESREGVGSTFTIRLPLTLQEDK